MTQTLFFSLVLVALTLGFALVGLETELRKLFSYRRTGLLQAVRVDQGPGQFIDLTLYVDRKPLKVTVLSGTAYDLARELLRAVDQKDTHDALGARYWEPEVIPGGKPPKD